MLTLWCGRPWHARGTKSGTGVWQQGKRPPQALWGNRQKLAQVGACSSVPGVTLNAKEFTEGC